MTHFAQTLPDEAATVAFGTALAQACHGGATIFLQGDLGAGKTTLARGLLQGLGHDGAVKSPTYTLVEPYEIDGATIFHFDLYRLADPEELEFMGIRDYFSTDAICLVEWPDRGAGLLPAPDITVEIQAVESGRRIQLDGKTGRGCAIIAQMVASERTKE